MRSFRIGSVAGIPIKLHPTFLLVLPLFAYLIGSQIQGTAELLNATLGFDIATGPLTSGVTPWFLGTVAAIGLFAGVMLHELGHSLAAMRFGYAIDAITLWIFGGIAQFTEMPEDWRQELVIAIAGPIVSILLGVACYGLAVIVPGGLNGSRFVMGYLALLNVALAAFNLLPGFPMDGGRVLRALLARTRPYARATQIAASVGKTFAILLGLVGLLGFNIILLGIAFFIYIGASSEATQTMIKAAFENVRVRDIMTPAPDIDAVSPDMTVADLLEQMFRQRHVGYPVTSDGTMIGMVTLDDVSEVPTSDRDRFTVADVMSTDLKTVSPETEAGEAFMELQRNSIGRLAVIDEEGKLVGILTRTDLMTAVEILSQGGSVDSISELDTPVSRPRSPS